MTEISEEVKTGKEVLIDYFTCTFEFYSIDEEKELDVVDDIVDAFSKLLRIPQENIYEKEFGKGNYRYVYDLGEGISLKICGPLNASGIHTNSLEMKGEGCREFERQNGKDKWYLFFLTMSAQFEARCTRIDLTIDDYDGNIVSFNWLKDKLEREMYTSAFKKSFSIHGNKYDGYSITFGQRKSNSKTSQQLCIYEKNKEQLSKGVQSNQPYWTRYEMRFMHEKAQYVFIDVICAFDGEIRYPEKRKIPKGEAGFKILLSALLYGLLDIKEDSTYDATNLHKVPTDTLWRQFVQTIDKAKIPSPKSKNPKWNKFDSYIHQTLPLYMVCKYIQNGCNFNQYTKSVLQELTNDLTILLESDKKLRRGNSFLVELGNPVIDKSKILFEIKRLEKYLKEEELPF